MKIKHSLALLASLSLLCSFAKASDWPVRDRETIQKTLPLTADPMRLIVDNVSGYVHVTGVSGSEVRITAHKTIRAETDADLAQARAEVNLEITQKPGTVSAYYAAPWRCKDSSPCHSERHFYDVTYDIDVEAPVAARLVLSAINGGIKADNSSGNFEVKDINGGIQMSGISGSGSVNTINGAVSVHFTKNPTSTTSFKSINGQLDLWLQPNFSADLLFKTFNGQIYSDFDVAPRPVSDSGVVEKRNGMFLYSSRNKSVGGRAGNGGPEISFDAFNGSIRLHQEK